MIGITRETLHSCPAVEKIMQAHVMVFSIGFSNRFFFQCKYIQPAEQLEQQNSLLERRGKGLRKLADELSDS